MMNALIKASAIAGFLALAACGGQGDDALADNVAEAADNRADVIDQQAESMPTQAGEEAMHDQADAVRDAGEAKADAIDKADVNAAAMTEAQKNAIVNSN